MPSINDQITSDRARDLPDAATVRLFRDYAAGRQPTTLTDKQRAILRGVLGNAYCDNVCDAIVSATADRLEFEGWAVEDDVVQTFLDELYVKNQASDLGGELMYAMGRDRDAYLLLTFNPTRQAVEMEGEDAWDGTEGMYLHYDARRVPLYAVKEWRETVSAGTGQSETRYRRVVYLDSHVRRYISADGYTWEPFQLGADDDSDLALAANRVVVDEDGLRWPAWQKLDGSPLHIPVVHFPNISRRGQRYGESDLDGGVLAKQDFLNDTGLSIKGTERMTGFPIRWAKGLKLTRVNPDTGKTEQVTLDNVPGALWATESETAAFGQLAPGDLSQVIASYTLTIQSIARISKMPLHIITNDWPSGEALLRAEMPLVDRVRRRMARVGPQWATVGHRATEIANRFMGLGLDETEPIRARWRDPERRDPASEAQAEQMFWQAARAAQDAGISLRVYLKRKGWSQAEIDEVEADRAGDLAVQERSLRVQREQEALAADRADRQLGGLAGMRERLAASTRPNGA